MKAQCEAIGFLHHDDMAQDNTGSEVIASPVGHSVCTPFDLQMVSISKAEHIQLKWNANYWRTQFYNLSAHRDRDVQCLKDEMARRDACYARELSEIKDKLAQCDLLAAQVHSELQGALDKALAHIKDLQKRLFGQKSEKSKRGNEKASCESVIKRPRGHQKGQPGHGRAMSCTLPAVVEAVDLPEVDKHCPDCGLALTPYPGTEDSEVIEIEVKAYRRIICRKRYEPACLCCAVPTIVTAPVSPKVIPKGKYGVSIWTELILDKFLYGRPTHRLLQSWEALGLDMAAGTVVSGFAHLAPMFVPLMQAFQDKQHLDTHWHADETGWKVFERIEGKKTNRWYLWVYRSHNVIYFDLEPSRAAAVPEAHFNLETAVGQV